jgi:hypothetical protein
MAGKRALVFRAGTVGMLCAATEVEIVSGTELRAGTITPIRSCANPATEILVGEDGCQTGLCAPCRDLIVASMSISTVKLVQRPRNN